MNSFYESECPLLTFLLNIECDKVYTLYTPKLFCNCPPNQSGHFEIFFNNLLANYIVTMDYIEQKNGKSVSMRYSFKKHINDSFVERNWYEIFVPLLTNSDHQVTFFCRNS